MMKKLSKLFIVLIFILIPNVVFAAEYNHIYLVEEFNIGSNAVITVNGYSFVSHMDNYGVYSGKGNLKTRIIAYTGDWNDAYASVNTCNNSPNCYVIDTTNELQDGIASDKVRDFWAARCTDSACFKKNYIFNYRISNGFSKTCSGLTTSVPDGSATGSHCLYYNVGFKAKIKLENLYEKFQTKTVKFKIIPYIEGLPWKSSNSNSYSDLSIYHKYCSNVGKTCKATANEVDAYSLDITGLSDKVYFDAMEVLARDSNGKTVSGDPKFQTGVEYKVLNFISNGIYSKTVGGSFVGNFSDSLLKLASKLEDGKIVSVNGSSDGYYAYANYVKFSGAIQLKTKLNVIKQSCSDWDNSSSNTSVEVNCGQNKSLNQCKAFDNVTATIYVKSDSSCVNAGSYKKVKVGDVYYIPIDVSTNVLIKQKGEFSFGSISPNPIAVGKGFSLGTVTYNNEITWINANRTSSGDPYYRYDTERYVSSGGSCVKDDNFSFRDAGIYYYYDNEGDFKTTSTIEDAALNAIDVKVNSSYINDEVGKISDNIKFKSCDSNNSDGCNKDNVDTDVNGIWSKSLSDKVAENITYNYKNSRFGYKLTNKYSYSLFDSYVALKDVIYDGRTYKAGSVMYKTGLGELEGFFKAKKYYVDFRYDYDIYPFNLDKNINPSLIDEMVWRLNGICSLNIDDGDPGDPPGDPGGDPPGDPGDPPGDPPGGSNSGIQFRFRSISLSNPFPKANAALSNIAINWREWYKENDNVNRIKNTYANGINYKIAISNYDRTGYFSINDINKTSGNYSELKNFDLDGSSNFVTEFFGTNGGTKLDASKKVYCGLGFFSEDCNKLYVSG